MIIPRDELAGLRGALADSTIALRFGSYDILHDGHQAGIDFASKQADVLIVGVMPDVYVRSVKGDGRPVNPEEKRLSAIDQAPGVDYSTLVPSGRLAIAGLFLRLRPDVYVEENVVSGVVKAAFLRALGINYVTDRDSRIYSTSKMIEELGVEEANCRSSLSYSPGSQAGLDLESTLSDTSSS